MVGIALNAAVDRIVAVDHLEPGAIHRPTVLSVVPGGKAANAARAAASLGLPARVVGVIGGHAGAWYKGTLEGYGVDLFAVTAEGETRTCLSLLDRSTGELTEFYEPGLTVPAEAWPLVERALVDALNPGPQNTVVLLAGSLPPGVPEDGYRRLGAICEAQGARWVVDISGPPLVKALEAAPWLVKINEREAAETVGGPDTSSGGAAELAMRLRDRGAGNVLLTRGRDGALLATPNGAWTYGPPPVTGPYSVGSGDALVAGLITALARGSTLPAAVRYGSAVAAANALVPGQGVFDPARVDELHHGITMDEAPMRPAGRRTAAG